MHFNCSKTVLVLSTIALLSSASAFATSGGHSSCGPTGQTQTNPQTNEPQTCDSWEGTHIYDIYDKDAGEWNWDYGWSTSGTDVVIDGVSVQISVWSDTGIGSTLEDDTIHQGTAWGFPSNGDYGIGIVNADEESDDYPEHAIDNLGYWEDFDMVLLTFSEAVSLTGATFSWVYNDDPTNQQVTIAGLTDVNSLTSGTATWSSIASSFVSAGTANSFGIEKCEDVYQSVFTTSGTSQYWLVGAYNTAFGDNGFTKNDDAWKLASVGFNKEPGEGGNNGNPDPVNAPSSFALLLLAGGFAAWRRKKA